MNKKINMTDVNRQNELVTIHTAKAQKALEYGNLDDAKVHLMISKILNDGLKYASNHSLISYSL